MPTKVKGADKERSKVPKAGGITKDFCSEYKTQQHSTVLLFQNYVAAAAQQQQNKMLDCMLMLCFSLLLVGF